MGKGGGKAKPTEAEKELARVSAERFNHYITNYRGPETQFIQQAVVSAGQKSMAQGAVAGEIETELGGLERSITQAQGAAGVTANSSRRKFASADVAEIRGTGRGDATAKTGQAADDMTLSAKLKIASFGQELADGTVLSLSGEANRATRTAISKADAKAQQTAALMSAVGTVAGAWTFKEGGIYDKIQARRAHNKGVQNVASGQHKTNVDSTLYGMGISNPVFNPYGGRAS